jgi:hypothetical protein
MNKHISSIIAYILIIVLLVFIIIDRSNIMSWQTGMNITTILIFIYLIKGEFTLYRIIKEKASYGEKGTTKDKRL